MKALKEYMQSEKLRKRVIFCLGVFGLLLTIASYIFTKGKTGNTADDSFEGEIEKYGMRLENRLEETLSSIIGKDSIEIMITFSDTCVTVYNTEENFENNSYFDIYSSYELSQPKTQRGYASVKQLYPKITGVVIVCKKKLNNEGYVAIKKAAATALNISESKIYLIGGEESNEKNS